MFDDIRSWLSGPAHHRKGVRALEACIGAALLFRAATEAPFAAWLWGPQGLANAPLPGGVGLLYGVLAIQALGALSLLTGRATRVGVLLCLVAMTLFESRTIEINDGGDNLARLCLGFLLMVVPAGRAVAAGSLQAYFHNLGIALLIGQVIVLYFVAGLAKAMGEVWMNGTALYLISQVEEFSLPALREVFKNPFVTVGASYATVGFQLFFPIAFFSRFKLAFLFVGMTFHVAIASFMGLVTFSAIMAGADLLLITDVEYSMMQDRLRALAQRVRGRARRPT